MNTDNTCWRITVRGRAVELRGHLTGAPEVLHEFAEAMEPFGLVVASIAPVPIRPAAR